jgi:hypothetical protein
MSFEMPKEGGKIREFARATRFSQPAFVDWKDAVVAPTFLTTARYFWTDGANSLSGGLRPDAGVARGRRVGLPRPPPRAGQTLTVTARIGDRYEKQGSRGGTLRLAVLVHEFRDAAGQLVAEERMTLVETSKAPTRELRPEEPAK